MKLSGIMQIVLHHVLYDQTSCVSVVSLVIYRALCNNWIITTSAPSIALYISAYHSPLQKGAHSVYKHSHIVTDFIS